MRWRWPFLSKSRGSAAAAAARTPRPKLEVWRKLPAVETAVGPPPLTIPASPSVEDLTGHARPEPILVPLEHARSLTAPRGLIVGIAAPAAQSTAVQLPLMRSVQRSAVDESERWQPTEGDGTAHTAAIGSALPAIEPRPLPAVRRVSPPRSLLTTGEADLDRTEVAIARSEAPSGKGRPAAPFKPVPAPDRGAAAPPADPAASPRLTLAQSRRLGLGAPLAESHARTSAAEGGAPPPAANAGPSSIPAARSQGGRRAPTVDHGPQLDAEMARVTTADSFPGPSALARAAGRSELPGIKIVGRAAAASTHGVVGAHRSTLDAGRAPVLARRQFPARVQRAPLGSHDEVDQPPLRDAQAAPAVSGEPVVVHRGPETAQVADALHARAFTHAGQVFLPEHHGPLDREPARSILAHELVHADQQQRLGSDLPPEDSTAGQLLEHDARRGEHAPLTLRAARTPGAVMPSGSSGLDRAAGSGASGGTAQLAGEESEEDERATQIAVVGTQRAEAGDIGGVGASPGNQPSTPGGGRQSERELELLASRLYERIRLRLRRELLADRERAGLLTDVH